MLETGGRDGGPRMLGGHLYRSTERGTGVQVLRAIPSWATEAQSLGCPRSCRKLTHHKFFRTQRCRHHAEGLGLHLHLSKDVKTESRGKKLQGRRSLRRVFSAEFL